MVIRKINSLRKTINSVRRKNQISFVPTMGNFHKGHLSLIEYVKKRKDFSVVSIFVNPLQFENEQDLRCYPRTKQSDINLLEKLKVDLIFIPENSFVDKNISIINTDLISEKLCGIDRPGHFQGVATVILKFLNLIHPDKIILGEKDFQQTLIIKQIIKDFFFPTKVITLPTVRDENGLALSSRNNFLEKKKRLSANIIFECLNLLADEIIEDGIKITRLDYYKIKILRAGFEKVNYLEILKEKDLNKLDGSPDKARIFVSAIIDNVRIIDNFPLIRKLSSKNGRIF
ncbi:MAG: pantoate--beta-alanine ligase [Rickettsiales bacterium]|nr:pantoate--beta-alanine ligase [Rickettsiales bacterium]